MKRQKFSLNKNYNKIRPKTPLSNKRQTSNKSFKSNIGNINNNRLQRNSPKTIDYEQLMEKYGNMLDDNFDKLAHKKVNKKPNKTIINKTPDDTTNFQKFFNKTEILDNPYGNNNEEEKNNLSTYTNIKKNKNLLCNKLIRNKKNNFQIPSIKTANQINSMFNNAHIIKKQDNICKFNRCISNNSNAKNKNNIHNNSEFEKLKKEIFNLKKENEKLKANTITHNTTSNLKNIDNFIYDKFLLLLNLCRKYARKFDKLYPLCELEFTKYNVTIEIFEELKNTIIQYNSMIFSDKISNLFKLGNKANIDNEYENILNPLDISNFEPKSMAINFMDKYKSLIKKLKEENKDYNNMKKKMEIIMKENNELKKKVESFTMKENKYNYQNNIIEKLKCQVETLNNSNKFKESKINTLQNIIEKNKSNPNLFSSISNSEQILDINIQENNNQLLNNNENLIFNNKEFKNDFQFKNINRYDNNNIISKITISSYNENLNSKNNNSNVFINNNAAEETIINNDIIKSNIECENVNIKTPSEKKIKKNDNFYYEEDNIDSYVKNKKEKNILNDEIEQLDQEIINLKSKLTQIIKK